MSRTSHIASRITEAAERGRIRGAGAVTDASGLVESDLSGLDESDLSRLADPDLSLLSASEEIPLILRIVVCNQLLKITARERDTFCIEKVKENIFPKESTNLAKMLFN